MLQINKEVPIENILSKQIKIWQKEKKRRPGRAPVLPSLTISRQYGSRGEEVARAVSKKLGWQIYDKEIVDYIASNNQVRKNMVELFDEKTRTHMEEFLATFLSGKTISKETYFSQLVKTITALGKHGRAIIAGRGANFILPDKTTLKVYIVENFSDRQVNLSRLNAGVLVAEKQITAREAERAQFIKKYFKKSSGDPLNYDLVINLSKSDIKTAVQIILSGMMAKFDLNEDELKA